jgi:hypothetical protein
MVDITPHLLQIGTQAGFSLTLLGVVDYQVLVAELLFGNSVAGTMEDGSRHLLGDSPRLATSPPHSLRRSAPESPTSRTQSMAYGGHTDGGSEGGGTSGMRQTQRSVSLGEPVVTVPAGADRGLRSNKSTSGLRRRPRRSVLEVFKFQGEC